MLNTIAIISHGKFPSFIDKNDLKNASAPRPGVSPASQNILIMDFFTAHYAYAGWKIFNVGSVHIHNIIKSDRKLEKKNTNAFSHKSRAVFKIGRHDTYQWVLRSNELTQEK